MLQGQGEPTSGVLGAGSVRGNGLAVRLHRQLLEVGGESVEVLVEAKGFQSVYFNHHRLVSSEMSTYGATRRVWAWKKSPYQTPSRPPMTGMFSLRGVSRKCLSMA